MSPSDRIKKAPRVRLLTDEVLDGFDLAAIKCRSCSGYGNCGYKSYYLSDDGVVSICMQRRKQLQNQRDGVPCTDEAL